MLSSWPFLVVETALKSLATIVIRVEIVVTFVIYSYVTISFTTKELARNPPI